MDEFCSRGKESTRRRNLRASKSKRFDFIRNKKLIETNADDLWAVMKAGGAFTNHYLRWLNPNMTLKRDGSEVEQNYSIIAE